MMKYLNKEDNYSSVQFRNMDEMTNGYKLKEKKNEFWIKKDKEI